MLLNAFIVKIPTHVNELSS